MHAVTLRPFRPADATTIVRACADEAIREWTRMPSPYGEADAAAFINYAERAARAGDEYVFGMVDAADEVLGAVGAIPDPREPYRAEIGYWVAPWSRRRGVGRSGVALMLDWLRSETRVVRVHALVYPGNTASERLLIGLGFRHEGLMSAAVDQRGTLRDANLFATLIRPREQWSPGRLRAGA